MNIKYTVGIVCSVILLTSACSYKPVKHKPRLAGIDEKVVDFPKGPLDKRNYRYVKLDNGLKVILVSDPKTKESAANLLVHVGSNDNPDEHLGLAHFLEHMLFIKNKKYPEVDGYIKYITAHGGHDNASTGSSGTQYYFSVNSDYLEESLDRLSQFFISPVLDKKYVELEKKAVNSEYVRDLSDNGRRSFAVLKKLSTPNQANRFKTGNLETLKNDKNNTLVKELKLFFKKYYVASNMELVVYGKESLRQLQTFVQQSFADLPVGRGEKPKTYSSSYYKPSFLKKQQGIRINIDSFNQDKALQLIFPIKDSINSVAFNVVRSLLYWKGEGGLNDFLIKKGLSTGIDYVFGGSYFKIEMDITDEGLKQVDAISGYVMDYLYKIKQDGLKEWLYDEQVAIEKLKFITKPPKGALDTVQFFSGFGSARIQPAYYYYNSIDKHFLNISKVSVIIDSIFDSIRDLRQVVIAKGLKFDQQEHFFKVKYGTSRLSEKLFNRLEKPRPQAAFRFPKKDHLVAYIPESLQLKTNENNQPIHKVIDKKGLTVWSLTDSHYKVPKGVITISLKSPMMYSTLENSAMSQIYGKMISNSLKNKPISAVKNVGLHYSIDSGDDYLSLYLSGLDNKQPALLEKLLEHVRSFKPSEKIFNDTRNLFIKKLENKQVTEPVNQAATAINEYLYSQRRKRSDIIKMLKTLSYKNIQQYSQDLYQSLYVRMLVYGNFTESESVKMANLVESKLLTTTNRLSAPSLGVKQLGNESLVWDKHFNSLNSVYVRYVQGGKDFKSRAVFGLLSSILESDFFAEMRTNQQLGYVVRLSKWEQENNSGLLMYIESPSHTGNDLSNRVDKFFNNQASQIMNDLTSEKLDTFKNNYITQLNKPFLSPASSARYFWHMISIENGVVDYKKQLTKAVSHVTKKDLRQIFNKILNHQSEILVKSTGNNVGMVH